MKFSIVLPALAVFTSAFAAPLPTSDFGANAGANVAITTGVSANMLIGTNLMNFGAGFSIDTCQVSMKAWLQAKGLCEADGSIGAKAQAYLQGCLGGKAGFEGLFGLKAGLVLGGQGQLIAGIGANANAAGIFKGAAEVLLKGSAGASLNAGAGLTVDQAKIAIKAWLQTKGQCEADGSIGVKAQAYINGVLGGKAGFEGLLGVAAGIKLDGSVKVIAGVQVGTLKDACTGLTKGGLSVVVGGQVSGLLGGVVGGQAGAGAGVDVKGGLNVSLGGLLGGLLGGKPSTCSCPAPGNDELSY